MKDGLLLYSGGLDSTVMLYKYIKDISEAVFFYYGAKQNRYELECARFHCSELDVKLTVVDLKSVFAFSNSALLTGEVNDCEKKEQPENIVPFRNGIFLSVAASYSDTKGLKKIFYAPVNNGYTTYPDANYNFINSINHSIYYGTINKIMISTPFSELDKWVVRKMGQELKINLDKTYSCYRGDKTPCGKCESCVERKIAFEYEGQ